jgi:hypothetical protein
MDRFIGFESAEFKELTGQIGQARQYVQDIRDKYRPALMDKRYLSGEEVMEYLHVSPRTLQTFIGGTCYQFPVCRQMVGKDIRQKNGRRNFRYNMLQ